MSETETGLKKRLLDLCLDIQKAKIVIFKKAMDDAQNSANSEEKSSAGDKYETSRAMSQNERDMNAKHLSEALKEQSVLQQIKPDVQFTEAKTGAIIKTTSSNYFIATGLGEIELEGTKYFVLSAGSPLAQAMLGKKKGDEISFRNDTIKIKEVI
jgi:transcription elongation GreA/GreB family factor